MRRALVMLALLAAGCGGSDERATSPSTTPAATATATAVPGLDELLRQDPGLKSRKVRACVLERVDDAAAADLASGLQSGDAPSQEKLRELAGRCRARAGLDLGVTQDVLAESGADVPCALRRLRRALTPAQLEKASEGDTSASASRAVAEAIAACR